MPQVRETKQSRLQMKQEISHSEVFCGFFMCKGDQNSLTQINAISKSKKNILSKQE